MSTPPDTEHVPTAQEEAIYAALSAGDLDGVERLRADAYAADQTPPPEAPFDWVSPARQFDIDYVYALDHYHDDNEMPEAEREDATRTTAAEHNADAEGAAFALFNIEPDEVTQGDGEVRVHLYGQGFTTAAQIWLENVGLATAHVSDAELYCTIDAGMTGYAPGAYTMLVRQQGQNTDALPFTIAPAAEAEPAATGYGDAPTSD